MRCSMYMAPKEVIHFQRFDKREVCQEKVSWASENTGWTEEGNVDVLCKRPVCIDISRPIT